MNDTFKKLSRLLTTGAALFSVALFTSCSEIQKIDTDTVYKHDIQINVNGEQFDGVAVCKKAESYNIVISPPGDMDALVVQSCHRDHTYEKQTRKFLWFRKSNNEFEYTYTPKGKELGPVCPLRIESYEVSKGRNSVGFIDFEHADYTMQATLNCNGETVTKNGVSICQVKSGLIQSISFSQPVQFADPQPDTCERPEFNGVAFEWAQSIGACTYEIRNSNGDKHRLITIGYQQVPIRKAL